MKHCLIVKYSLIITGVFLALISLPVYPQEKQPDKVVITQLMKNVADYQIKEFTYKESGNLHDYGLDAWTNAVLFQGMVRWADVVPGDSVYWKWLMEIGTKNQWKLPANFRNYPSYQLYHADEFCFGQFCLLMYDKYKEDVMMADVKDRIEWIIANPGDTSMHYRNKQSWTWCDALFMAPPVYAHLSNITGDDKYLEFMHQNFLKTYTHLYDRDNHLFYRDDSYFSKKEANGEPVFWGRGNGWALAGIVIILDLLSENSEIRPFYQNLFIELATRLTEFQNADGFWHASLLDPESYPSPETSATALITYGLAYGINHQLLDESYRPKVWKAWEALTSVVNEDGRLGFVQPIGADPKKVTREMTAVYGVGAFLLTGTEILKF